MTAVTEFGKEMGNRGEAGTDFRAICSLITEPDFRALSHFRNYCRPKARRSSGFFLKKKPLCTLLEKSRLIPKMP
jgi:hypothetical protein